MGEIDLDDKREYLRVRMRYSAMKTPTLENEVARLYRKKYEEHDLESYEPHRIASAVLNRRTRSGTGLIFHMNKFLR